MRVVVLGKGGSGKSSLAGLLCAVLAKRGDPVLAIDADTVPGLAQVLGVDPTDEWFLAGAAVRRNGGWQLAGSPEGIVGRCSRQAPSGVRFLQLGNADAKIRDFELSRWEFPERWSAMMAFHTIARSYDEDDGWVVVDLQGGTQQAAGGMVGTSGVGLVMVEPFAKSVLTARRFVEIHRGHPPGVRLVGVANKVAGPDDEAYVEAALAELDLPLWGVVPYDPAMQRAERAGTPLFALKESAPARAAVDVLVERLDEAARRPAPVGTAG